MKDLVRLFFTGFGMGTADLVPGVSGGTIAFIFGIYEELVYSIKKVSGETLRLILKGKIMDAIKSIPFSFLVPLGLGIVTAFALLSHLLSYLLDTQPVYVWSFFFGLVVASIWIVRKRVVTWDLHDYLALLLTTVIAFVLVGAVPVSTPATPITFFLSGFIAIIAMILPGISGSFLLVLMGKYEQVLNAVVERDIVTLGAVFIGAVIGLALFSRVLSWAFERHHDIIVAALTGFMVGSLRKIWPWSPLPIEFNMQVIFALMLMVVAAVLMVKLEKLQATVEHVEDIEDKEFSQDHRQALKKQKKHTL